MCSLKYVLLCVLLMLSYIIKDSGVLLRSMIYLILKLSNAQENTIRQHLGYQTIPPKFSTVTLD